MKRVLGIIALVVLGTAWPEMAQAEEKKVEFVTGPSRQDARYRYFRLDLKDNSHYVLLDTTDGRLWQIKFGAFGTVKKAQKNIRDYKKLPIQTTPLVEGTGKAGRFTLFPTQNHEMALLLDQEEGRSWSLKLSGGDKDERFLFALEEPLTETAKKDSKK